MLNMHYLGNDKQADRLLNYLYIFIRMAHNENIHFLDKKGLEMALFLIAQL